MSSCSKPSPASCSTPSVPRRRRRRTPREREPALFLNSYAPLVVSRYGRSAQQAHDLQPFVDGSVRREPDLEHAFPSISCICRGGNFAPRLRVGDVVVYVTMKRRYDKGFSHRRLTAVLEVTHTFDDHEEAAAWYRGKELALPNNCMVEGNPPFPVTHSHRECDQKDLDDDECTRQWDRSYRARTRLFSEFVVCRPAWVDVGWTAPVVHDDDLHAVFGRMPGTRNSGRLPLSFLPKLAERFGVAVPPCAE